VPGSYPELDGLPAFRSVERRRFEIPMPRTTDSYVGWLRTDSLVNTLDDASRAGFLADIARLIDTAYGGRVARNFLYEVISAEGV
jgi:hypothetical protein